MSAVAPGRGAPTVAVPSFGSTLEGTGRLIRFILRRDRARIFWWTFSIVFFYAYFMVALDALGAEALVGRALLMESPSGIVMGGPGYGLDAYTPERAVANEGITWFVLALGVMSVLHMVRHTRSEEESGRSELVRANPVGRHAPAVASVVTLVLVNAVIAVLSAMTLIGIGGEYVTFADSFAITSGVACASMVFGLVGLVFAQLTVSGRGAVGLGMVVLGLGFVVRAVGDVAETGGSTLSWFSPFAWAQQMRPFVDLIWWPILLSAGSIAILLLVASVLGSRRDFGGGLLPDRIGPATATASLRGPIALAWRQQRFALLVVTAFFAAMWLGVGTMLPTIGEMVGSLIESNPQFGAVFGDPGDPSGFLGLVMLEGVLFVGAYAIVMGARPKAEENAGRAEIALARPVSRTRWFGAHILVTGIGVVIAVAVPILAVWVGAVAVGFDRQSFGDYALVAATYVPSALCYLGFTVALYGWFPRATGLGWLLLVYGFVIGLFGSLIQDLPEAANYINPIYWVPGVFETPDLGEWLGVAVVALGLCVLGMIGFRRRDIPAV
ncbi:ABC transporter permease [Myceligenerans indicum]|uniref:ABC transporter permease n=1 Tax=Myceligenerans indicum TaxID=2593663 RepID=A0ABS1LLU8_9MICO|nr:hypothetical protein [Myceligenerans indicum]MBL0887231.1 hypothetical protein [Myceligenerans indicum]